MLNQEQTLQLIKEAQSGSECAKSLLLQHNYPLIKSVIKKFLNKGVEYDDLYQLGCVGFLKAIANFDEFFNVKFSTYVVPMVAGEVKRFLRDDGSIKVSRALKVLNFNVNKFINEYRLTHDDESPQIEVIANEFNVDEHDVIMAMESGTSLVSLNEKFDEDDSHSQSIIERIQVDEVTHEQIDYIMLKEALAELDLRDKKLIILRYFRNKTQSEVAKELGVSQVQVSRLETKILSQIRKKIE